MLATARPSCLIFGLTASKQNKHLTAVYDFVKIVCASQSTQDHSGGATSASKLQSNEARVLHGDARTISDP